MFLDYNNVFRTVNLFNLSGLEPLGYRDPYYDRRNDPYGGPRSYDREWERDPYRDKPPMDYEKDRYERDHYLQDERYVLNWFIMLCSCSLGT